jgi:hypothetical protein
MAIKLYTGLPGAGKSLSLVDELRRMHEREPGRLVFAFGIDGLKPGLAQPCDPRKWEDLPDGSIVVVDEAQKVWPSRRAGDPPDHVRAFSEHRHRGFDFLIATQNPKFIDTYLRGLVDQHTHVVRRWNDSKVDRYIWQEGQEDVKSRAVRAAGQRQRWKYPKECFDMYKSSTMHTMKRRLPWQYWLMIAAGLLAVPMIWYAVHRVVGLRHLSQDAGTAPSTVGRVPGAVGGAAFGEEKRRWPTPEAYVEDHLPRVANQPWSAPVFDQVPVKAQPDLLCIEYHRVIKGVDQELCSCYTEQVTPYELHSLVECRRYARDGVYNPRWPPVGSVQFARVDDQREPARSREAGTAARAAGPADASAWQPAWRTRAYVQPEKTVTGGPSALSSYGGGDSSSR